MTFWKRLFAILLILVVSMAVVPLIGVKTVRADAGMAVTLLLFFAVYPVISGWVGMLAGQDLKRLWFVPVLTAVLFWTFSTLIYGVTFPLLYSGIYFAVCALSMAITNFFQRKKH